jgi:predicted DNA-binding WGR domain protein
VIQLLHPIGNNSSCTLYTRWGRVGETGATQKKGPFTATQAISEFKKQFKAKAATDWSARFGMTVKAGEGRTSRFDVILMLSEQESILGLVCIPTFILGTELMRML